MKGEHNSMAENTAPSPWDTGSGLPDDVDGIIAAAEFGFKQEYAAIAGSDAPMLMLKLINEEGEEIGSPGFSCGAGWNLVDGGKAIHHPVRESQKVIKTSIYGQLIDAVKALGVPLMTLAPQGPTNAEAWLGMKFHWKQVEHSTVSGDVKTQLMPTAYLGQADLSKLKVVAKAAPAAAAAGAARPAAGAPPAGDTSAIRVTLANMAVAMDDVKDFQKAAFKLPQVLADSTLMGEVADDSQNGFWFKSR